MARILLFDPDQDHARTLVSALEHNSYTLTVCASRVETLDHLKAKLAQFKVVILDFSNRPEDWELLERVCTFSITCVPKPGILCLARTNWGSDVKLKVERKGARLLYERSA
ncbi:MAG TPA: hypothetical protein VGQ49_13470 [Bryobacteraceae bacterium]|jgi:CheY-like chemotaxis protein|nr:hypothetical protein [Bryobacteraceae bacterium]